MSAESIGNTLLTLEEIKASFPPKEETFKREVRDGVDIIKANVSRNSEGVIVYVETGSADYIQRASKPETGGV